MGESTKISAEVKCNNLCIYIDGLLHLNLRLQHYLGLQSYVDAERGLYCIDYHMGLTTITSEYAAENLWKEVLKVITELKFM